MQSLKKYTLQILNQSCLCRGTDQKRCSHVERGLREELARVTVEAVETRAVWGPSAPVDRAEPTVSSHLRAGRPKTRGKLLSQVKFKGRTGGILSYSRESQLFVLFGPSTDWAWLTHIREGNLLHSDASILTLQKNTLIATPRIMLD